MYCTLVNEVDSYFPRKTTLTIGDCVVELENHSPAKKYVNCNRLLAERSDELCESKDTPNIEYKRIITPIVSSRTAAVQ